MNDEVRRALSSLKAAPKRYKAMTVELEPDPFTGRTSREVRGYYVKHLTATPYPISTVDERDKFIADHTKHYIFSDGFSDWGLPRSLERWEVDISTLEELNHGV